MSRPARAVRARLTSVLAAGAVASALTASACSTSVPTAAPTAAPTSTTRTAASAASPQVQILSRQHLGGRTWDLYIRSPAVGAVVTVRLLLPPGYRSGAGRHWPVLYLLHGCCDTHTAWTRSTDVAELTRHEGVLVVMPDGGQVGFYSDWRTGPGWETFHTVELPALLAREYSATGPRVVAGLSMGGLGALDYAARHPGAYAAAASFSGIADTRLSAKVSSDYEGLIQATGESPLRLWGDPHEDAELWRQHNPYDLAPRLRGTRLFLSAGNGRPGPLDPPGTAADPIEASIGRQNHALATRLQRLGIPAHVDLYGPGTHSWAYWQRELHRAWPMIRSALRS